MDYFRNLVVPEGTEEHAVELGRRFYKEPFAGCLGRGLTGCPGTNCNGNCLLGLANRRTFETYLNSLGITEKDYENMVNKDTFTITVDPCDQEHADLLQVVAHGWESVLSMLREVYKNVFEIYADGYGRINLTVNVTRLQDRYVDVDELYSELLELKRLLDLAFPCDRDVAVAGELEWEHGDHTHIIRGEGKKFALTTEGRAKEMTVDQISKALGYTIRIVKG